MKISQIDFMATDASQKFAKSVRETGFAVFKNHPINYDLVQEVFSEWTEFFASGSKEKYLFNKETQDGLFPMRVSETAVGYNIKDIKEFFHYYPWGQYPTELSDKTKQLYAQMNQIAITILDWAEENLPVEIKNKLSEPLSHMIENTDQTLMRILHYPPLQGNEDNDAIRAGAHTDINLITILVAASQSGLQVQDTLGNWIEVPVDPGMISINIGDMLQLATDGYYKSTVHQVVNPVGKDKNKSRYSIPLFLHPRPEVQLSATMTAGEYLEQRLKALGVK